MTMEDLIRMYEQFRDTEYDSIDKIYEERRKIITAAIQLYQSGEREAKRTITKVKRETLKKLAEKDPKFSSFINIGHAVVIDTDRVRDKVMRVVNISSIEGGIRVATLRRDYPDGHSVLFSLPVSWLKRLKRHVRTDANQ